MSDYKLILEKLKTFETLFLEKFRNNDKAHERIIKAAEKNTNKISKVERQQIFWKGALAGLSLIVGGISIPQVVKLISYLINHPFIS